MKAFAQGDFVFKDAQGRLISHVEHQRELIIQLEVAWRVQKNRRNGQSITLQRDTINPRLCMVNAAIRIHIRSTRFDPPGAHPPGFYIEKGKMEAFPRLTFVITSKVIRSHMIHEFISKL